MLALAFVPTFAVAVGARRVWVARAHGRRDRGRLHGGLPRASHQCPPGWRARLLRPRARVFPGRLPQLLRHDAPVPPQRLPAHACGRAPRDLRVRARRGDPDRRPAADRRRRRPRRRRGVADDPRAGLAPAPRRRARSGRRAGGALPAPKRHASRAGSRAGVRGRARARRRRRGRVDIRLRRQGRVPDLAGLGSVRPARRPRRRPLRLELALPRDPLPEEEDHGAEGQDGGPEAKPLLARDDSRRLHGDRLAGVPRPEHGVGLEPDRLRQPRASPGGRPQPGQLGQAGGDRGGAQGQPPDRLGAADALGPALGRDLPGPGRRHRRPLPLSAARPDLHGLELRTAAHSQGARAEPGRTTRSRSSATWRSSRRPRCRSTARPTATS